MSFWRDLPQPYFILAPMEAVTDVVFRRVIKEAAAPDLFFTEFTNATGWVHAGDKALGGRLVKTNNETNLIAHLWGSVPEDMAKLAAHARKLGFVGIDINMGCPDKSATKSGGGAALCKTPELASEMISAAKTAGLPVSVKCRLGYSFIDEYKAWIPHLLSQNIENLSVHLRTKKEMSKVSAHYELISEIVKIRDKIAPNTLLTINGDIENRAHGLKLVQENPGVNGVMIGRGIFANPFAFANKDSDETSFPKDSHFPVGTSQESKQLATNESSIKDDNADFENKKIRLLKLLQLQLDSYDEYSNQTGRPFDTLKRFFKIYVRDFENAAELRDQLMHTKTTAEVRYILSTV